MLTKKDLPQIVSTIGAKNFEIQGYVDAGDLLRTDHSIQIDEDLSGEKTVSIRGGNPEEVVVLYNGVKLNNSFDNVFDLSLIDLEDVERIEIIKGSNTALYGAEAFSGVINVVPKIQQDYNIRFQQRLGTYRSGNWGLHFYKNFDRLYGTYSVKRGGSKRAFKSLSETESAGRLENSSTHHTANLNYVFSKSATGRPENKLGAMWIYSKLDYDNFRDHLAFSNINNLLALRYTGNIAKLKDFDISLSYRRLQEEQKSGNGFDTEDKSLQLNVEKSFSFNKVDLLLAYQLQRTDLDHVGSPQDVNFKRSHHGVVSILKYHASTGSNFLRVYDMDFSVRHDRVLDERLSAGMSGISDDWQNTMFRFALHLEAYRDDLAVNGFLSVGDNTKFPTLLQQISRAHTEANPGFRPNRNPERNRNVEIGFDIIKDLKQNVLLYGLRFSANYFKNIYENKIRTFHVIGEAVPSYDNVQTADIAGLESKSSAFLLRKKVTLEFGYSRYFISEKAAFPFKSDFKRTLNVTIDHAGYSLQIHWFKEGEQSAWVRRQDNLNQLFAITLPSQSNLDIHLSKTFLLGKFKLFANVSGRNMLNGSELELQGLAIRDRRFYLTLGAQY